MLFPSEQQRPDILKAREIFREEFSGVDAQELIFLDESGLHLGMTRLYGRGLSHERVKCLAPFNKGTRVTMIAAIGVEEVKASWYGDWHLDGDIFIHFIKECLVPVIQSGQVVMMDNLQAHKVSGVKELIESTGARLVYLPSYSPDFTPIELFWSKIKSYIRKKEARNLKDLGKAITEAFKSIQANDLENWFEHCGYSVQ
jgi:transposase